MNYYEKLRFLCHRKGISISKMCDDVGLSRSTPKGWTEGKTPNIKTLQRICDYFQISSNYFSSENDTSNDQSAIVALIKMELFGAVDVSDKIYNQVKEYAKFLIKNIEAE